MNSITMLTPEALRRQDEARKLVVLRDRLVELGIGAELRENDSTLMVPRPEPGLPIWVVIEHGGAFYAWDTNHQRHPVHDPQGAALALAHAVKRRR
ncbi:hypothetical protein [Nonomuraea basaltis]|uniref:hypothetical protein n=1 Tax=Nonomuraea basaltis TaxID=2495887 RepID=UPI00110C53D7|nr:hypothetical protein [Nonomuraea basaltis]TMR90453.1 hypothetical protein EJK15_55145 [Nonomuraea basaltis]